MLVEQPEAFKNWLTAVLKPLCDADPAALSKYVIALIKKDKDDVDLRKSMLSQLEVFLQEQTETFVNLVFETLENQEYLKTPVIPNANPPNPNIAKSEVPKKEAGKEIKVIVQPNELPSLSEQINGSSGSGVVVKKDFEVKRDRELRENRDIKKIDNDEKVRLRIRHRSSSRNRSRSRSWDRSKRSRSREKSRDRELHRGGGAPEKRERVRVWRNKSPPSRRYERRRSRGGSRSPPPSPPAGRIGGIRSRSRSPRYQHRGRYRNRSSQRSPTRSRSRSNDKLRVRDDLLKEKDVIREPSRPGTPTQDSNHGDVDPRLTLGTQSVQSCIVAPGVVTGKRRCRDFDEKGFCMRGEMCPFDHGVDPVVLEDSALSTVLSYNPNGTVGPDVSNIPPPLLPGHPLLGPRGVPSSEYNPQAPQIYRGFRGPRPPLVPSRLPPQMLFPPPPNMNRELISIPVMDNKQNHYAPAPGGPYSQHPPHPNFMGGGGGGNNSNENHHHSFQKKKNFDFNRLGPRNKNPVNCSLELKKVPSGLNSITHLNNHFTKFGKIVNIQVNYEGDPEAALVTFSSHAEANAAYRSTEAVLNNRFIKVFWHNNNSEVQPRAEGGAAVPQSTADVSPEGGAKGVDTIKQVPVVSKEETKAQATAAIKKNQELLVVKERLKKDQNEQRKEMLKIKQDLRKRKQELLEKQLSQQKILIEKMEKSPAGPQRDLIKETIKKTQESIEEIRKDIAKTATLASKSPAVAAIAQQKKTKEDTQKELLDAELDLITKQQEGADTSEIQKRLLELRARNSMLRSRARGGGGRRFNPIGRHLLTKNNLVDNGAGKISTKLVNKNTFPKHTVDHRPAKLLVSGYETEEQDGVLVHFQQYGEITDFDIDSTLPSVTLVYKTRKEAEMALLKGKHFQDRTLSITWSTAAGSLTRQLSVGSTSRTVIMSESEEEHLDHSLLEGDDDVESEIPEEILLKDDEEEDEENEDRSWRR